MRPFFLLALFVLVPPLAHSATYYVSTGGSRGASCADAQSPATPRQALNAGAACLSAGDTLVVDAGLYAEQLLNRLPSGTPGHPTTMKVKAGAVVTVKPPAVGGYTSALSIVDRHDIVVEGFIFDGTNIFNTIVSISGTSTRITLQHNTIRHMRGNPGDGNGGAGINLYKGGGGHNVIRKNVIENVGLIGGRSSLVHGIYVKSTDNLIEGNIIRGNSGHGVHVFDQQDIAHRNLVRGNAIYDNGSRGILLCCGDGNRAEHNTLWGNRQPAIVVGTRTADTFVTDNTIWPTAGCLDVSEQAVRPVVRDNRCQADGTGAPPPDWIPPVLPDRPPPAVLLPAPTQFRLLSRP